MSAIIDTTPVHDSPATYTVQINRWPVVATFQHYRREANCRSRDNGSLGTECSKGTGPLKVFNQSREEVTWAC